MTRRNVPVCYGYQGKGNVGDNLMFLLNTSGHDRVCVKTGRKVRPRDIALKTGPFLWALLTADEVIFSGGNIFNVDRWRSYVKIIGFYALARTRRVLGKRTSFLSIGLNRNTPPVIHALAVRTILAADHAHLRETSIKASALWRKAKEAATHVEFKPDVVFTGDLDAIDQIAGYRDLSAHHAGEDYAVYFPSVVARHEAQRKSDVPIPEAILPEGIETIYVIIQAKEDAQIRPAFFAGKEIVEIISTVDTIDRILALVLAARVVVTERYHGAILAKRFGVPMIASGYSEKLRHMEMLP